MTGKAWTSVELEFDWTGDYQPAEPDVGVSAGWENITLEGCKFDITDFKLVGGQMVRTTRTVHFDLTPEQVAMFEALFADDAAEGMSE